ncbi:hypothetical protein O181_014150 [Austropuccinia psidii MF-1]|uniref:Uncharacterized protein n=1 Tax=Austropuccinia psidii MF-1 TaxID=1389203 RepID=A0A9Q3C1C0_9BASI|nr:hypothetical protein [Austropuccinia psidii MF-1]
MENGKQEIQPGLKLGLTWGKFSYNIYQRDIFQRTYSNNQRLEFQQEAQALRREGSQDKGELSCNSIYRRAMDSEGKYSDFFRLTMIRLNQLFSGFTPLRIHKISGQESSFFTIPGSFQGKIRTRLPSERGRKNQTQLYRSLWT